MIFTGKNAFCFLHAVEFAGAKILLLLGFTLEYVDGAIK